MSFWKDLRARTQSLPQTQCAASRVQNISINPYAMSQINENTAEIVLYGDIVSERPTDWYGEPVEGQFIILSDFLKDLAQFEDVAHLTVRIHSAGGNAFDAMVIHNRLQSLAANITVIVDGIAMSGGSLIMCAGDSVQVYPGSLIMIHKCWSFLFGGYNSTELRKMADSNDAVDRSQAAIYHAKTGIDTQELLAMMETESYMTGQEAIDKGFADELVDAPGMEIAASADRRTLFVGGRPVWETVRKDGIPAVIPTVNPAASAAVKTNINQPAMSGNHEGGNEPMATTIEELREEYPELTAQLEADAKASAVSSAAASDTSAPSDEPGNDAPDAMQEERARIQAIDQMAGLFDTETVSAAKYGKTACTAQEMVYRAAQKAAKQGQKFLAALESDTAASGANGVGAAAADAGAADDGGKLTPQQMMAQGRADAKALNRTQKEGA